MMTRWTNFRRRPFIASDSDNIEVLNYYSLRLPSGNIHTATQSILGMSSRLKAATVLRKQTPCNTKREATLQQCLQVFMSH